MSNIYQLENVSSGYNQIPVLKNINLSVKEGDFVGIIGPNGSGKTTLLKTITRVLDILSGKVYFKNREIKKIKLKEIAREVAFVPQETFTIFSFSVLEVVMMGRTPHLGRFEEEKQEDFEIVKNALEITKCTNFVDKDISQLSAGERQRVIIAKALAQEPKVLILDEPTSRLDIGYQIEIFDLIKSLNKKDKTTIIAVLHNLNLASDYCDKIILLDKGEIFQTGSPEEVLNYKTIEKVYNTVAIIKKSPITGKPYVFLVPGSKIKP